MKERTNVKINLGLRVLGRRSDGFHDIETLFLPFQGLGDEIEILPAGSASDRLPEADTPSQKVCLTADPPVSWETENDLCVRAYRLLDAEFGLPPLEIRLHKQAPTGAGLGGGSADAAWTLRMLRDMFALPLPDRQLAVRAAALGSDCPFFIYNRPMTGRGRGEVLESFDIDLSRYKIEVAVPSGVAVNTGEAYRAIDASRATGAGTADGARSGILPLEQILSLPPEEWRGRLVNDFEAPVFAAWPQVAALKEAFYARGAVYAAMSGSGSAVFGIFPL